MARQINKQVRSSTIPPVPLYGHSPQPSLNQLHKSKLFYYQINKIMQKSSIEKLLKAEGHYAGDLVSLDFKSESLHSFLENVVQLVNQHSQRINAIELDKLNTDDLRKHNQTLLHAGKLNPALAKEVAVVNPAKGDSLPETFESIGSNFSNHSAALQFLWEGVKRVSQRVEGLSGQLDSFQTKENVKEGLRKGGLAGKKAAEEESDKVLTRLKDLEMKTNKRMSEFQNLTKEVEKKTLWKISECETALLKKITPEYVEKALEQMEAKMHSDIANNKNQQLNELKFALDTQKARLEAASRNIQDYEKENKALIKDLQEQAKSFEKRERIDHDRRDNDMRMKELLIKIDRLEKRQDPQDLELRITKITAEHHERLQALNDKTRKLEGDLASINNVMASMGGVEGGSGLDPHKLCHMDGEVRRLRDCNRTNEVRLQAVEDEVKMKLLAFEERIMATLGMLKGQDNFVSREEMYESLARLREPVMQKLGENQTLIYEVNGKLSKLEMFEKATKRKIKELTRGDDLNKILDLKMSTSQAEAQFNGVNMKLENLEIILNKLRMEVDASSSFLRLLENEINEPEQGINIIGPKQKVFPAKCLGCGTKHVPTVHDNNMMQGTDGKYYKVDLKNSYLYDQREVYGVTPSQIAVYDSGVKKRITSASNRPTSSRTNIRPSSAKHF